jgi:hypothetical protein
MSDLQEATRSANLAKGESKRFQKKRDIEDTRNIIASSLYDFTLAVLGAAQDGFETSTDNKYFPQMLGHGLFSATLVKYAPLPEPICQPKPLTEDQKELLEEVAEKAGEDQVGAAREAALAGEPKRRGPKAKVSQ